MYSKRNLFVTPCVFCQQLFRCTSLLQAPTTCSSPRSRTHVHCWPLPVSAAQLSMHRKHRPASYCWERWRSHSALASEKLLIQDRLENIVLPVWVIGCLVTASEPNGGVSRISWGGGAALLKFLGVWRNGFGFRSILSTLKVIRVYQTDYIFNIKGKIWILIKMFSKEYDNINHFSSSFLCECHPNISFH